jgi:hypothetical protein
MRFSVIDLLFGVACFALGSMARALLWPGPASFRQVAGWLSGIGVYLALIYPVYRGLKLFPMVLPRCACCRSFQDGFHTQADQWPRVSFLCPTCNSEFVVWHNGKPGDKETWDKPVLVLKWPYAFGRYKRVEKPEADKPNIVSVPQPGNSGATERSPSVN